MPPKRCALTQNTAERLLMSSKVLETEAAMLKLPLSTSERYAQALMKLSICIPELLFLYQPKANPLFDVIADPMSTVSALESVIESNAALAFRCDDYGVSPLHMAALHGRVDLIKVLIEKGGAGAQLSAQVKPVELESGIEIFRLTPLMVAVYANRFDVVQYLTDYATSAGLTLDVHGKRHCRKRQSLLHVACVVNSSMVNPLIAMGANVKASFASSITAKPVSVIETALLYADVESISNLWLAGARLTLNQLCDITFHSTDLCLDQSKLEMLVPRVLTDGAGMPPAYFSQLKEKPDTFFAQATLKKLYLMSAISKGKTFLNDFLLAIMLEDEAILNDLIENDQMHCLNDTEKSSMMTTAASFGNVGLMAKFIELDFPINHDSHHHRRPMAVAVANDQEAVVDLLLEHNAELDFDMLLDNTSMPFAIGLIKAGNASIIRKVLPRLGNPLHITFKDDTRLLDYVVRIPSPQLLEVILEFGVTKDDKPNIEVLYERISSLMDTPEKSKMLVSLLRLEAFAQEASIEISAHPDLMPVAQAEPAAGAGASSSPSEDVKIISVSYKRSQLDLSMTPFHMMCIDNRTDLIEAYTATGMPMVSMRSHSGQTPLHMAVVAGAHGAIERLVNHPYCEIDSYNHSGITPIMIAIGNYDLEAARLLLTAKNDRYPVDITQITSPVTQDTVLHLCAREKPLQPLYEELTQHKVNFDIQNKMGETPLFLLVQSGNLTMAKRLLEGGADPKIKTKYGVCAWDIFDFSFPHSACATNPVLGEFKASLLLGHLDITEEDFHWLMGEEQYEAVGKLKKQLEISKGLFDNERKKSVDLEKRINSQNHVIQALEAKISVLEQYQSETSHLKLSLDDLKTKNQQVQTRNKNQSKQLKKIQKESKALEARLEEARKAERLQAQLMSRVQAKLAQALSTCKDHEALLEKYEKAQMVLQESQKKLQVEIQNKANLLRGLTAAKKRIALLENSADVKSLLDALKPRDESAEHFSQLNTKLDMLLAREPVDHSAQLMDTRKALEAKLEAVKTQVQTLQTDLEKKVRPDEALARSIQEHLIDPTLVEEAVKQISTSMKVAQSFASTREDLLGTVRSFLDGAKSDYIALKKAIDSISEHLRSLTPTSATSPAPYCPPPPLPPAPMYQSHVAHARRGHHHPAPPGYYGSGHPL